MRDSLFSTWISFFFACWKSVRPQPLINKASPGGGAPTYVVGQFLGGVGPHLSGEFRGVNQAIYD